MRVCRSTQPLQGRSRIRLPSGVSADCRNVRARGWHRLATEGCGARHPAEAEVQGRSESRRCASASMARDLGRLVAGFSTATLNHPPHSFTSFRSPQRGPEGAADWECDLERARHDRRCSGATSGRPLAERCGGRLAIPRPASWPEPPRVADTRTRVPERSGRAGQDAASPRRPPGPSGWCLSRRGFKAIHGPAVAEWGRSA